MRTIILSLLAFFIMSTAMSANHVVLFLDGYENEKQDFNSYIEDLGEEVSIISKIVAPPLLFAKNWEKEYQDRLLKEIKSIYLEADEETPLSFVAQGATFHQVIELIKRRQIRQNIGYIFAVGSPLWGDLMRESHKVAQYSKATIYEKYLRDIEGFSDKLLGEVTKTKNLDLINEVNFLSRPDKTGLRSKIITLSSYYMNSWSNYSVPLKQASDGIYSLSSMNPNVIYKIERDDMKEGECNELSRKCVYTGSIDDIKNYKYRAKALRGDIKRKRLIGNSLFDTQREGISAAYHVVSSYLKGETDAIETNTASYENYSSIVDITFSKKYLRLNKWLSASANNYATHSLKNVKVATDDYDSMRDYRTYRTRLTIAKNQKPNNFRFFQTGVLAEDDSLMNIEVNHPGFYTRKISIDIENGRTSYTKIILRPHEAYNWTADMNKVEVMELKDVNGNRSRWIVSGRESYWANEGSSKVQKLFLLNPKTSQLIMAELILGEGNGTKWKLSHIDDESIGGVVNGFRVSKNIDDNYEAFIHKGNKNKINQKFRCRPGTAGIVVNATSNRFYSSIENYALGVPVRRKSSRSNEVYQLKKGEKINIMGRINLGTLKDLSVSYKAKSKGSEEVKNHRLNLLNKDNKAKFDKIIEERSKSISRVRPFLKNYINNSANLNLSFDYKLNEDGDYDHMLYIVSSRDILEAAKEKCEDYRKSKAVKGESSPCSDAMRAGFAFMSAYDINVLSAESGATCDYSNYNGFFRSLGF